MEQGWAYGPRKKVHRMRARLAALAATVALLAAFGGPAVAGEDPDCDQTRTHLQLQIQDQDHLGGS